MSPLRLTPRNCHLLMDQRAAENHPWWEMLVKIQEVTRDLTGSRLLLQMFLLSSTMKQIFGFTAPEKQQKCCRTSSLCDSSLTASLP